MKTTSIVVAFMTSLITMSAFDAVWLLIVAKKFYTSRIGHLMAESASMLPALLFYLIYTFALTVLIIIPALQNNWSLTRVFFSGALFGLAAYSAYDLTNQATLKNWPVSVTIVDMLWGTLVAGLVCLAAVFVTKHLS